MLINNNDKDQTIVLNYINSKRSSQQLDPVFNNHSQDSNCQNSFDPFPATPVATSNSFPQNQTTQHLDQNSSIPFSEQHVLQNLSDPFPATSVATSNSNLNSSMVNQNLSDPFPATSVATSNPSQHQDFTHDSNYLPNHINNTETQNSFDPFPATSVATSNTSIKNQSNMISIAELIGDDNDNI